MSDSTSVRMVLTDASGVKSTDIGGWVESKVRYHIQKADEWRAMRREMEDVKDEMRLLRDVVHQLLDQRAGE